MSVLSNAVAFMVNLGIYDVVLPFLLVFTIVYALLEKTKVLGVETVDGVTQGKKNLNAMVAFVTGFLVIASTELVRVINTVLANVVLLILLGVLFLMLVGSLGKDEEVDIGKQWKGFLVVFMFIGILIIFLHALGWLEGLWLMVSSGVDGTVVGSVLLIAIVVAGIAFITGGGKSNKGGSKKE